MPKFCQRCGAQNMDWAQACQNCAGPLPDAQAGNPQGYYPNYPPQPGPGYNAYPPTYGYYGATPTPYLPGEYAGIGKRFLANILESLLIIGGMIPGFVLMIVGASMADTARSSEREMGEMLAGIGLLVMIVGYLCVFLYNIYLLGRDGASLPKKWMGIAVLDRQGRPLGFGKALVREILKGFLGNACLLLLMWPLWDPEKQGLYDKILNANVYEPPPGITSLNVR